MPRVSKKAMPKKKSALPRASKKITMRGLGAYSGPDPKGYYKNKYKQRYAQYDSIGGQIGGFLGNLAQKGLMKLTGLGEYSPVDMDIKKNAILEQASKLDDNAVPQVVNKPHGAISVRFREYLGDVVTSSVAGQFNVQTFQIQPGLLTTFPWLAQIAAAYQEYSADGILFEFKSESADALNSTNTALGTVIMATDYDSADVSSNQSIFVNKQSMCNTQYSCSGKQSMSLLHPIECARNQTTVNVLHVRQGTESNTDLKFYDVGTFGIATQGGQAASVNIGSLWVTYQISFYKPHQINALGYNVQTYKSYSTNIVPATNLLGSNPVVASGSLLPMTQTGLRLSFPPLLSQGEYLIVLYWTSTNPTAGVAGTPLIVNNCQVLNLYNNGNGNIGGNAYTSTTYAVSFVVKILNQGAYMDWTGNTFSVPNLTCDILVQQLNGAITPQ